MKIKSIQEGPVYLRRQEREREGQEQAGPISREQADTPRTRGSLELDR